MPLPILSQFAAVSLASAALGVAPQSLKLEPAPQDGGKGAKATRELTVLDVDGTGPRAGKLRATVSEPILVQRSKESKETAPGGAAAPAQQRAFLGVTLSEESGAVRIDSTVSGSAAEKSELQAGDIIVSIDGNPVSASDQVVEHVRGSKPGDVVEIQIRRGDDVETRKVTLRTREGEESGSAPSLGLRAEKERAAGAPLLVTKPKVEVRSGETDTEPEGLFEVELGDAEDGTKRTRVFRLDGGEGGRVLRLDGDGEQRVLRLDGDGEKRVVRVDGPDEEVTIRVERDGESGETRVERHGKEWVVKGDGHFFVHGGDGEEPHVMTWAAPKGMKVEGLGELVELHADGKLGSGEWRMSKGGKVEFDGGTMHVFGVDQPGVHAFSGFAKGADGDLGKRVKELEATVEKLERQVRELQASIRGNAAARPSSGFFIEAPASVGGAIAAPKRVAAPKKEAAPKDAPSADDDLRREIRELMRAIERFEHRGGER